MLEALITALSTLLMMAVIALLALVIVAIVSGLICGPIMLAIIFRMMTWESFERKIIIPLINRLFSLNPVAKVPKHMEAYLDSARARGLL